MKMEENLGFISVLKRAKNLLFSNINLLLFLFLCSLPLFCFMIFFELSLQTTVSLASQFISHQLNFGAGDYKAFPLQDLLDKDLIPWLIQTFLLYFFPYTVVDLLTTMSIVAASSTSYMSEEEPLGFRQLVQRCVKIVQSRFRGCLVTSLYVLFFSTSVFFGFFFAATNYFYIISLITGDYSYTYYIMSFEEEDSGGYYYTSNNNIFHDPVRMLLAAVMALFHGAVFIVLLVKFSKWSAGWNMGLVVSVLEEGEEDGQGVYGSDALTLSAYYGRGHEKTGQWVMLVFLVFTLALRMPCLCFKCSESWSGNGVFYTSLYVGLICVGNVIKWVACVVWYHDCRTRVLEKKGDVEIGSKAKSFAT